MNIYKHVKTNSFQVFTYTHT